MGRTFAQKILASAAGLETVAVGQIVTARCPACREQPALGLKAVGIQAVVAKSFARIFYRAAINQGLLLVECPEAVDAYEEGDQVTLDAAAGHIAVGAKTLSFPELPPAILAIRDAGGLLPYTREALSKR